MISMRWPFSLAFFAWICDLGLSYRSLVTLVMIAGGVFIYLTGHRSYRSASSVSLSAASVSEVG
jgi:hypothetical protein